MSRGRSFLGAGATQAKADTEQELYAFQEAILNMHPVACKSVSLYEVAQDHSHAHSNRYCLLLA